MKKARKTIILSQNRNNKLSLMVRNDYIKELDTDKYFIAMSNQEYFVFPLLVEECLVDDRSRLPKEIDTMEAFMKTLSEKKKIIINRQSDTGKSILARAVFRDAFKEQNNRVY